MARRTLSLVHTTPAEETETVFVSEQTFDQAQFVAWLAQRPSDDSSRYELLDGRIVMTPPTGWPWDEVEARLVEVIAHHVRTQGMGRGFGPTTAYELPSGHTLSPEASVVLHARWSERPPKKGGFHRVVPNLVAEVITRGSRVRDSKTKLEIYARAGIDEYWLVDQEQGCVTVLHRGSEGRYDQGDVFRVGDVVRSRVLAELAAPVDSILVLE